MAKLCSDSLQAPRSHEIHGFSSVRPPLHCACDLAHTWASEPPPLFLLSPVFSPRFSLLNFHFGDVLVKSRDFSGHHLSDDWNHLCGLHMCLSSGLTRSADSYLCGLDAAKLVCLTLKVVMLPFFSDLVSFHNVLCCSLPNHPLLPRAEFVLVSHQRWLTLSVGDLGDSSLQSFVLFSLRNAVPGLSPTFHFFPLSQLLSLL